jgi:hypothetical protein
MQRSRLVHAACLATALWVFGSVATASAWGRQAAGSGKQGAKLGGDDS